MRRYLSTWKTANPAIIEETARRARRSRKALHPSASALLPSCRSTACAARRTPAARRPNIARPRPQTAAAPAPPPNRRGQRRAPCRIRRRAARHRGYADYNGYGSRQPQQRQQPYGGGSAAFTEISWDALRSGDLEQSAQGNRRAAPAQPQTDPYGRPVQPQREAYRPAAQPRQADPYYNAAQPQTDPYGRTAQPQQRNDPYRRSDGSYRQPYATGGYRAAPQPPETESDPFTAGVSRSGKRRRALTRLPSVRTGIITVPAPFAARHSAPLRDSSGSTPPRRPPSDNGGKGLSFRLPRIGKNRIHPAFLLLALVLVGLLIFGIGRSRGRAMKSRGTRCRATRP